MKSFPDTIIHPPVTLATANPLFHPSKTNPGRRALHTYANFVLSSLKWYEDNDAVHAIGFIFQRLDLKFRHRYEAITAEVGRLTDVDLRAEVRDTRLEVVQSTRHKGRKVRLEGLFCFCFCFLFCLWFFFIQESRSGSCTL